MNERVTEYEVASWIGLVCVWIMAGFLCVCALVAWKNDKPAEPAPEIYARAAVVTAIDAENDLVIVTDCMGFMWDFYGVDDWCIGDGCSMAMNDNGTETIFDDEIISVRYERFDLLENN